MGKDKRLITRSVTKSEKKHREEIKKKIQEDFEYISTMKFDREKEFEFAWLRGYFRALEDTQKTFF